MTANAFKKSSGLTVPVWEATFPMSKYPTFEKLTKDTSASICIVGSGIAGITMAYEAVKKLKRSVVLIEARGVLSGETGRTTGHLSSANQGDNFASLIKNFGQPGAQLAYESHQYAIGRVQEIAKEVKVDCEFRYLPAKTLKAEKEEYDLQEENEALRKVGCSSSYSAQETVGDGYKGAVLTMPQQGTFHPTKYLAAVLESLKKDPKFTAYTETRYVGHERKNDKLSISVKGADGDHTITADSIVLATNMPPYKIAQVINQHYSRTYAIAVAVPKDVYDDVLIYDNKDPYIYVRKSGHPDSKKEYLIVGGEDHKVGIETQENYATHFANLEAWTRKTFLKAGDVEYKWSGQVVENVEGLAHIGQSGDKEEYIITGDNGNGLTHGTLAAKLLSDLMSTGSSPWAEIYSPSRTPAKAGLSGLYEFAKDNIIQQKEYLRLFKADVSDVEEIPKCSGRVMREGISPVAVYKSETGELTKFSAICPHLQGVVSWNPIEGSWDCPNHGSRFSGVSGECLMGPAKMGLHPKNEKAEEMSKDSATT